MGKFSSKEIESQYDLIKMLLAEPEKYKDAIEAIKKDIAYMPGQLSAVTLRGYFSFSALLCRRRGPFIWSLIASPRVIGISG